MSIDRKKRDDLVRTIDRYCHDELSAFEFDDAIFEIRSQTSDATVQRVVDILWHFYDDCQDHRVHLERESWNYFQRLRLLLQSDATLDHTTRRIWTGAQIVAALALAAFGWVVSQVGFGQQLYLYAIPFGLVSIGLSAWRGRQYRKSIVFDVTLSPFTSIGQILWVGKSVAGFRKDKYRPELAERRARGAGSEFVMRLQMYVSWLLFGPVILAYQSLPMSLAIETVRRANTEATA